jgi:hypothetical protein
VKSEDGRLEEDLLDRAQHAIDAAADIVAHSAVLTALSRHVRDGSLMARCAWCGRYRVGEDWVKLDGADAIERAEITHGICDECTAALRRSGLSA